MCLKTKNKKAICPACNRHTIEKVGKVKTCKSCGFEVDHKSILLKDTLKLGGTTQVLVDAIKLSIKAATTLMLVKEELLTFNISSTTEISIDEKQFNNLHKLTIELFMLKGFLKAAGLEKYESFAIKQIIKSRLGPRPNSSSSSPTV